MVSFELDDFILDKDKTFWTALLSDGRSVYQDDERPCYDEKRSWVRLQAFCKENNLYVKKIDIRFRSHFETNHESVEGYFMRKGVLGDWGSEKVRNFFVCGPIIDGKIHITKWQIPELIIEDREIRDIEGNEDGIIWNYSHQAQKNPVSLPTI